MAGAAKANGNGLETQRERLNAAVREIGRINESVADIYAKYNGIGRTNWTIVLSSIAVATTILGALWWMSVSPISSTIVEIKNELKLVDETFVRKDMLEARREDLNDRVSSLTREVKDTIQRTEYAERQRATDQQMQNITYRLEEVRRDLNSIFPTTKVMDDLLKRIDRLERAPAK